MARKIFKDDKYTGEEHLTEKEHEERETDIFNRPLNWRSISRAYRLEQNYTCEECSFGVDDLDNNYDKRYIHTHHIDSFDLENTHRDNLKSVCVFVIITKTGIINHNLRNLE